MGEGGLSVSKEVRGRFHAKMLRGVRRRGLDWGFEASVIGACATPSTSHGPSRGTALPTLGSKCALLP